MKYSILISYKTGDTFKSEDKESYVEGTWENLNIIKQNLKRIKEHYLWYSETQNHWKYSKKQYAELLKNKPDFVNDKYNWALNLFLDNGQEYQYSTFWCGQFEILYGAKIEEVKEVDEDLEFTIN